MSVNATTSTSPGMDCAKVVREEIAERYLMDGLSDEDRIAFEEHYFECARCFEELAALQAIQAELRRPGAEHEPSARHSLLRWAPAAGLAAALVIALGVVVWMREPAITEQPSPNRKTETLPKPPQPGRVVTPEPSLEQLARVDPAQYEPPTLRDVPDEATARFLRGMEHYRKADYANALEDLRGAAQSDPDAAHIQFFLGVTHLMLGQDDAAIQRLRAAVALGDTPFLEDAHFYLAKALLRQKNVNAAQTELKTVVTLNGIRSQEAQQLLNDIERIGTR
jgi:tetratricopeptide (TPR) repeat protein